MNQFKVKTLFPCGWSFVSGTVHSAIAYNQPDVIT